MVIPQNPMKLSADLVLQAYRIGYFPMAEDAASDEVFWVRPEYRGIIPLEGFHLSRSLRKAVRQNRYRVTLNRNFSGVIEGCALPLSNRPTTWINADIQSAYRELHERGHAHSIEAWQGENLVGGLYGIAIAGAFFGESMFSTQTDASKICLVHLVGRLIAGGYRLLDTQFQNDHLVQFGTQEIPHVDYQILLEDALQSDGNLAALPDQVPGSTILQSITQTS